MHILRILMVVWLTMGTWVNLTAAEAHPAAGEGDPHAEVSGHKPLPPAAVEIFHIGPFPVTNSILVTWGVALFLIVFAQLAMRNVQKIPSGIQNFWEWLVESLEGFLEGVIGHDLVKKTFWFFATIFIFILFANLFGLIPGVGSIGWGHATSHGFHIDEPFFRGANADMNMTLAMALVFFACWVVWALQANGPGGFIMHIFGPKGDTTGALKLMMIFIFIVAGLLEVISILFRPVSLSFRLYGNIFAGENMLESMAHLVPHWVAAVVIPIPFYFLEVLVAFVQALVFMLLTAVFTLLICTHEEGHEKGQH